MKTTRLDSLFTVTYGNKFDYNKMVPSTSGVAFVGRRGTNQGVTGLVEAVPNVGPFPAGAITVALGGTKVLASFVQQRPFYTAQNVAVLVPIDPSMSLHDRFYYAMCIKANRFRYTAFGREANRTLRTLQVPVTVPTVGDMSAPAKQMLSAMPAVSTPLPSESFRGGRVGDLFEVRYGQSLELNRMEIDSGPSAVNFVSRTDRNNGVSARVRLPPSLTPGLPGELTVALGGSPLATFLQPAPFVCGRDVAILTPRTPMSDAEKLWRAMCIRANRYRFSYGRQANRTLGDLILPALSDASGLIDSVNTVSGSIGETLSLSVATLS